MKKILFAVLLLVPTMALAQIKTDGLSKEQIAELQAAAVKMKSPESQMQSVSATVRNEAAAWASLGTNIGSAMVAAAKEVGVAANDFSQTNLGKIVTVIVVYKVMGKDILGVVFGSFIMLFGFGLALWILASRRWGEVKYEYRPVLWGMWQKKVVSEYNVNSNATFNAFFVSGILISATLIVGLDVIF